MSATHTNKRAHEAVHVAPPAAAPVDPATAYTSLEADIKTLNAQIDELQRLPNGLTPGADIMLDQIKQTASGLVPKLVPFKV